MSQILAFMAGTSITDIVTRIGDDEKTILARPESYYDYRGRSPNAARECSNQYTILWPRSMGMLGDPAGGVTLLQGQDNTVAGLFEAPQVMESGAVRPYYVHGTVTDQNASPLPGTRVDLFVTSTELYVASVFCDGSGVYSIGTPYIGLAHFATANYSNNVLVGTSRNDLIPTLSPF